MIYRYLTLITLSLSAMLCGAKQPDAPGLTASKCFKVAPTTVISMIDTNTRLDMLDYFQAGMDRKSGNSVGGECYIVSEDPYSVKFVEGTGIEYQIFVLNPQSASPVIGVIETLSTPIPDSSIKFYDSRWKELPGLLPALSLSDWLKPDKKKSRIEVEDALPFIMASYHFDDSTSRLTVANNMAQYFLESDTPKALGYLHDSLTYQWDGKRFKLIKQ